MAVIIDDTGKGIKKLGGNIRFIKSHTMRGVGKTVGKQTRAFFLCRLDKSTTGSPRIISDERIMTDGTASEKGL